MGGGGGEVGAILRSLERGVTRSIVNIGKALGRNEKREFKALKAKKKAGELDKAERKRFKALQALKNFEEGITDVHSPPSHCTS